MGAADGPARTEQGLGDGSARTLQRGADSAAASEPGKPSQTSSVIPWHCREHDSHCFSATLRGHSGSTTRAAEGGQPEPAAEGRNCAV